MEEEKQIVGCVIDAQGRVHAIKGIDDFIELIERYHPELDEKWAREWEPHGMEFFDEASEWVFDNAGWIEMTGQKMLNITCGKPGSAAVSRMMSLIEEIKPEAIVLAATHAKPVRITPQALLAKMGE